MPGFAADFAVNIERIVRGLWPDMSDDAVELMVDDFMAIYRRYAHGMEEELYGTAVVV